MEREKVRENTNQMTWRINLPLFKEVMGGQVRVNVVTFMH